MHNTFRFAAAALCTAAPALAQPVAAPADGHARAIRALEANPTIAQSPGTLLVKFKASAAPATKASVRAALQARTLRSYTLVPNLELVETTLPVNQVVTALRGLAAVEYAEPDYVVRHTDTIPGDTYFNLQWGARNTGQSVNGDPGASGADARVSAAWDTTTGSSSLIIAVIDTGTQWSHPDLAPNIWSNPGEVADGIDNDGNGYIDDVRGWDFYDRDNNPDDPNGHGTHTAGTVGAVGNNGAGVAGMMWSCRIIPLRFLGPQGGYTSDAVLALQYAVAKGAKISNNSWGGGGYSSALFDAINQSRAAGHLFVAAAGNGGVDQIGDNNDSIPFYPASYNVDNVISVAATDNDDRRATFSNYGATSVDLGAPGVNIVSTYPGGYGYNSGTSMACPHVAGIAGLVWAANPSFTYADVRSRLFSTVRPISALNNITVTGGIVNAAAAVTGNNPPPPPAVPNAPGTPSITKLSGGQLRISWADNSSNEDNFHVQRERKQGNQWTNQTNLGPVGANVTSLIDAPGSGTFRYRVRASNATGTSAWSAWKQIKN
jgi:serine protease